MITRVGNYCAGNLWLEQLVYKTNYLRRANFILSLLLENKVILKISKVSKCHSEDV